MRYLFLIILLSFTFDSYAFKTRPLKANKRLLSCLPTNASSPGTSTTTDFGKNFGSCLGFTCNSGYSVSGSTCALADFNMVCAPFPQSPSADKNFYCSPKQYYGQVNGSIYTVPMTHTYKCPNLPTEIAQPDGSFIYLPYYLHDGKPIGNNTAQSNIPDAAVVFGCVRVGY